MKEAESQSKVTGISLGYPNKTCSAYACRANVKTSSLQKLEAWIIHCPSVLMVACADKEMANIQSTWSSAARGSYLPRDSA